MRKHTSGFTLVELLVVVGIITLLIAVLLPALNKARESAIAVQCQSNLRQQGAVLNMYVSENKGIIPHGALFPVVGESWWTVLSRYTGRLDASNNLTSGQGQSDGKGRASVGIWTCPKIGRENGPANEARNAQFAANAAFFLRYYIEPITLAKFAYPQFRANKIRSASGKIAFIEFNMRDQDTRALNYFNAATPDATIPRTIANDRDLWMNSVFGTAAEVRYRHNGRANAVYFDGHVEAHPIGSLTYRAFMVTPYSR